MDTLILSCGTGGGHNSAGAAVLHEMQRRGHNAVMLDPYTLQSDRLSLRINRTYISMVQRSPSVFRAVYRLGDAYRHLPGRSPVYYANKRMLPAMEAYLSEHHFDAVVMPHLYPAEIFTAIRRAGLSAPKTVFVATDYACIPFTEETECDAYVIPSKELSGDFISRGIPAAKLLPYGIPVDSAFCSARDRDEVRRALHFDVGRKYILTFGGSMGAGCIRQVVSLLLAHYDPERVRIVAVCGSNEALRAALAEQFGGHIDLLGYTNRMADYMLASDLIVCKPGGLSSTEAAVTGTALVHLSPISGCETANMEFFRKHGMCAAVYSPKKELCAACDELLVPTRRAEMIAQQRRCLPQYAAASLCDYLEQITQISPSGGNLP